MLHGNFLDNHLVGHYVVGHAQRIRETQVDFLLRWTVFVMGVLDGYAHLFQGKNGVTSKVACHVEGG